MVTVEIGRNIRLLRTFQHVTQEETAYLSRVSCSHLQKLEHSHRNYTNPTIDTLEALARAFQVDPRTLYAMSFPDEAIRDVFHEPPLFPSYTGSGKSYNIQPNVRLLRKSLNMTQVQLSEKAGVSVSYLRQIEQIYANVSIRKLVSIANALDVSLLKLLVLTTPEEEFMQVVNEARRLAGISNSGPARI